MVSLSAVSYNMASNSESETAKREFMDRVKLDDVSEDLCVLIYSVRDIDARADATALTGMLIK